MARPVSRVHQFQVLNPKGGKSAKAKGSPDWVGIAQHFDPKPKKPMTPKRKDMIVGSAPPPKRPNLGEQAPKKKPITPKRKEVEEEVAPTPSPKRARGEEARGSDDPAPALAAAFSLAAEAPAPDDPAPAVVEPPLYKAAGDFKVYKLDGPAITHSCMDAPPCPSGWQPHKNSGKGIPWVVVDDLDHDLQKAHDKVMSISGVLACAVAEFAGGRVCALVKKGKNHGFGRTTDKFNCYKLSTEGNVSDKTVRSMIEKFHSADCVSNLWLLLTQVAEEGKMPTIEEATEELAGTTELEFNNLVANAKRARVYKEKAPLQEAILTYTAELKENLKAITDSEAMIEKLSTKDFELCADDFDLNKTLGLKGVHCEMDNKGRYRIHNVTLHECISKPMGPKRPPMYLVKGFCLVGSAGVQKGGLSRALAREFTKRRGKLAYACGASLCPLGALTKTGKIKDMGAFVVYDFQLMTRGDKWFTIEEKKMWTYVEEATSFKAFYSQACLPKAVPRIFSMNSGLDEQGNVDYGTWFRENDVEGLRILMSAHLARRRCRRRKMISTKPTRTSRRRRAVPACSW